MVRKEKYTKKDGTPLKRIPWKKGDSEQHCDNCELRASQPLNMQSEDKYIGDSCRCFEINKKTGKYTHDCFSRNFEYNQKMYIFVKK